MPRSYEHFTDRARKVMQLANQEAVRFSHEYIDTEHILLGLMKEGSGIATQVLRGLNVDLRKIRLEVEKIDQSGPDMVVMGTLPQAPRAKKVIDYAQEEMRHLNHNYVGTEHLLLGLIREVDGVATQVLANLGVKLEIVRERTVQLMKLGEPRLSVTAKPILCQEQLFNTAFVALVTLDSLIKKLEEQVLKEACIGQYLPFNQIKNRALDPEFDSLIKRELIEFTDQRNALAKKLRILERIPYDLTSVDYTQIPE